MKQILLKSLFLLSVVFISCSKDDEPTVEEQPVSLGEYENSVLVINEGNFGEGDGSISAYKKSDSTNHLEVFNTVNDFPLGDVVQSAFIHDSLMIIVVNNSNRVEVVNKYTLELVYSITDVALPRYMTVSGDKGYLTEWVSFSDPGQVTIFDLATGSIDSRVTVGFGAENIIVENNKAYVSNSFGNSISIIDLSNNNVDELELSSSPKQMLIDANGDLWVACAGGFNANDGALYKIDPTSDDIETTINLNTNYAAKIVADNNQENIYYYVGNNVFKQDISSTAISSEPYIVNEDATSIYGIGLDPSTGFIYLGDSKAFLEDGEVYQYDASGDLITTFQAGRAPNGFVFN